MYEKSSISNHIADIIKAQNGGMVFYQEAQGQLDNTLYKAFLNRMIDEKKAAAADLHNFAVDEQGDLDACTSNAVKSQKSQRRCSDISLAFLMAV